jgi:hypothetical protein
MGKSRNLCPWPETLTSHKLQILNDPCHLLVCWLFTLIYTPKGKRREADTSQSFCGIVRMTTKEFVSSESYTTPKLWRMVFKCSVLLCIKILVPLPFTFLSKHSLGSFLYNPTFVCTSKQYWIISVRVMCKNSYCKLKFSFPSREKPFSPVNAVTCQYIWALFFGKLNHEITPGGWEKLTGGLANPKA